MQINRLDTDNVEIESEETCLIHQIHQLHEFSLTIGLVNEFKNITVVKVSNQNTDP